MIGIIVILLISLCTVVYITIAWIIISEGRIRLPGAKKRRKTYLKAFYGKESIFNQYGKKG